MATSTMEMAKKVTDEEYEAIRKKNKKEAKAALKHAKQLRIFALYILYVCVVKPSFYLMRNEQKFCVKYASKLFI